MVKAVVIDPELHKRLKVRAAEEEVLMSELAGRLLGKALEQEKG